MTGTDTGVGKTVVSAALLVRGFQTPLRYWKPIQTGIEHDDDTAEVRRLSGVSAAAVLDAGVRLPRPLSPHLSAELAGTVIDLDGVLRIAQSQPHAGSWIIEGVGGALVPLNGQELIADLMTRLAVPALVVTRAGLGTINHTLLTLEALARRSIPIAGVIMVGPPNADNRRAIERYGHALVLGELPLFDPLTPAALRRWAEQSLDREGCLSTLLQ